MSLNRPTTTPTSLPTNATVPVLWWAHGLFPVSTNGDAKFSSREWSTTTQRPQLVITTAVAPNIALVTASTVVSDPHNGLTNPKAIPGAAVNYAIQVSNSGDGSAASNSTIVTDAIPSGMMMFVGDYGASGSGPLAFTDGSPSSGLTYSFSSLSSTSDSISFSNNAGADYTYTPVPDANGYDANVTHFRVNLSGSLVGTPTATTPFFEIQLRMKIR